MKSVGTRICITAALAFGAIGCGGGDGDDAEIRSQLTDVLGLTEDQASCVLDSMGGDADVLLEIDNADFEPSESQLTALDRAGDECGLE